MVGVGIGQLDGERAFHLIALTMGGQVPSVRKAATRSQMGKGSKQKSPCQFQGGPELRRLDIVDLKVTGPPIIQVIFIIMT